MSFFSIEQRCLEAGARAEAFIDGRTFDGMSKTDRQRYIDRFKSGYTAYNDEFYKLMFGDQNEISE